MSPEATQTRSNVTLRWLLESPARALSSKRSSLSSHLTQANGDCIEKPQAYNFSRLEGSS